jgi:serine/threonine protein kinase/tetratricopeptide (TPR) repeat protein
LVARNLRASSELVQEQTLFTEALERTDPAERAAFLDRACAGDPALRERIERLLARHAEAEGLHDPAATGGSRPSAEPAGERPGSLIGPYKLVEQIGEGGFGVVFLAEQQHPVRRTVAVKVLKPGMDTAQVVARFEAERQALALMEHPNIAQVLDGGETTTGRPYFVMELVKGVPITQYCDDHRLSPRERLALFVPVCQAIQHAHQKGIVHRDVKPSNVLVAAYDGVPVPKVIDFGVAKAVGQRLTERTLVTNFGGVIGTLEYMSPEQAEFNALDIDTRADIYSLGVLLYELLTGSTPLTTQRLKEAAITEVLRLIREEEPPTPSTRLSASREALASISAQRKLEPARLAKEVRGELDWIVMKCLEKDRTRRYATANGLARDLQRFLADEPVEAGPPSATYQLRKFAHKYRKPLWVAAGFILLLAIGGAVSVWQAVRATVAERATAQERDKVLVEKARADEEAAIAKAVNEFLQKDLLGQADIANQAPGTERDKDIKVRELLDRAAREIETKFQGQELTEAAIRLTLGRAYQALGEYGEAQKHLERSRDLRKEKLGPRHADTLDSMNTLGLLLRDRSQYGEAQAILEQVVGARRAELGPDHPETLVGINNLATVQFARGRRREAEALHLQVLAGRRAQLGPDHPLTLNSMENLAVAYTYDYRFAESEPLMKQVLHARTAQLGSDHPLTLLSMGNLAALYRNWGRPDDAEPLFRQLLAAERSKLGADHPGTLMTMNNLAMLYSDTGRYDEAESLHEQLLETRRAKLGPDHPDSLLSMHNLAHVYWLAKRLDEAERQFKEAWTARRTSLGAEHPDTLLTMQNLGVVLRDRERFDEAEPLLDEAFRRTKDALGRGHWMTHGCLGNLAILHQKRGTSHVVEPLLREQVAFLRSEAKADSAAYADQLGWLSRCLLDQKKFADAEPVLRESLSIRQAKQPDAWTTFNAQSILGGALLGQKRYADAEPLLLEGYQGLRGHEAKIPAPARIRIIQAMERLVELYDAWGKEAEAARWRKELEVAKASLDFHGGFFRFECGRV